MSTDGGCLEFASPDLQNDPEIVKAAVSNSGWALQFASLDCRNDPEIVKVAMSNGWECLVFADDSLKHNKDVIMKTAESAMCQRDKYYWGIDENGNELWGYYQEEAYNKFFEEYGLDEEEIRKKLANNELIHSPEEVSDLDVREGQVDEVIEETAKVATQEKEEKTAPEGHGDGDGAL